VGLYSGRRFYVGVAGERAGLEIMEHIVRRIAWCCPASGVIVDRQLYVVGLYYDGDEGTIARNLACEQYLADQLCRVGLEPVTPCRACAKRRVRRASIVSGCLEHGGGSWGCPWRQLDGVLSEFTGGGA
jgi:hypothetical protein